MNRYRMIMIIVAFQVTLAACMLIKENKHTSSHPIIRTISKPAIELKNKELESFTETLERIVIEQKIQSSRGISIEVQKQRP